MNFGFNTFVAVCRMQDVIVAISVCTCIYIVIIYYTEIHHVSGILIWILHAYG